MAPHPVAAALLLLSSFSLTSPRDFSAGFFPRVLSCTAETMFGRKRSVSFGGFGWWVTEGVLAEMRVDLEKESHWVAGEQDSGCAWDLSLWEALSDAR